MWLILNMQAEASCSLLTWFCSVTQRTADTKTKKGVDRRCKPLLRAVTEWKRRRENEREGGEVKFTAIRSWETVLWQRVDGCEAAGSPSAFIKLISHTSVTQRWKQRDLTYAANVIGRFTRKKKVREGISMVYLYSKWDLNIDKKWLLMFTIIIQYQQTSNKNLVKFDWCQKDKQLELW